MEASLNAKPQLPSPIRNGWEEMENEGFMPVFRMQGATPKSVCGCRASKCNARSCKCVKNGLN